MLVPELTDRFEGAKIGDKIKFAGDQLDYSRDILPLMEAALIQNYGEIQNNCWMHLTGEILFQQLH